MKLLRDFIHSFDFLKMKPARDEVGGKLPEGARCQMLAEAGKQYAAYFKGAPGFSFTIGLPEGKYLITWLDVTGGRETQPFSLKHGGGKTALQVPGDLGECAMKLVTAPD